MIPMFYVVVWLIGLAIVFLGLYYGPFWPFVFSILGSGGVVWLALYTNSHIEFAWLSSVFYFAVSALFFLKDLQRRRLERDFFPGDFDSGKKAFYFLDKIENEMEKIKKHGGLLTVAKLDIDHFKQVNDSLGYFQGDMFLRLFGRILAYNTRPRDMAVRYAADEFLIVLPDTPALQAHEIIDNIRANLEEHKSLFPVRGIKNPFSFSAGIVEFSLDYNNVREFFRAVDEALFEAKKQGPSATVVLDKEKKQTFRNRRYWERIDVSELDGMELFIYDKRGIRHKVDIGNISIGGTMFLAPKGLNYSDIIDMELVLKNGDKIIIEGKQIWNKSDLASEQVGVFLMHLSPQQKFVLHRTIYGKKNKRR